MKSLYSFLSLAFLLSGCSVLVGQVKPVEEKATISPQKQELFPDPNWKKLEIPSGSQSNEDIPDAAWQSTISAAVISLNSVCRQEFDGGGDLKRVSRMLMSQWDNLKIEKESSITVAGLPALETTASGQYLNRARKFQTTIVKSPTCIYEMVFLSPVATFQQELSVFHHFRDNLNLK